MVSSWFQGGFKVVSSMVVGFNVVGFKVVSRWLVSRWLASNCRRSQHRVDRKRRRRISWTKAPCKVLIRTL